MNLHEAMIYTRQLAPDDMAYFRTNETAFFDDGVVLTLENVPDGELLVTVELVNVPFSPIWEGMTVDDVCKEYGIMETTEWKLINEDDREVDAMSPTRFLPVPEPDYCTQEDVIAYAQQCERDDKLERYRFKLATGRDPRDDLEVAEWRIEQMHEAQRRAREESAGRPLDLRDPEVS